MDETPYPRFIQAPAYGSPVSCQGWIVVVTPTTWTTWIGREIDVVPFHPTPTDKHPDNLSKIALFTGAAAPKASVTVVAVSLPETVALTGRGCGLGKRTSSDDIVSPPQRPSQSLVESVARTRTDRKFLCGGYNTSLKSTKVQGESVGEDEILTEDLTKTVDKFSLSLTNKDFKIVLEKPNGDIRGISPVDVW